MSVWSDVTYETFNMFAEERRSLAPMPARTTRCHDGGHERRPSLLSAGNFRRGTAAADIDGTTAPPAGSRII